MSNMVNKFGLTASEKATIKRNGIRLKHIGNYSVAELQGMLDTPITRAREIYAITEFQKVPSIGIRFAEDLVSMGYYSLNQLKGKTGAELIDQLELLNGYWVDPCVEDQCRLVVYFANTGDLTKKWWDFTEERKAFRSKNGYPSGRPVKAWHETLLYKK